MAASLRRSVPSASVNTSKLSSETTASPSVGTGVAVAVTGGVTVGVMATLFVTTLLWLTWALGATWMLLAWPLALVSCTGLPGSPVTVSCWVTVMLAPG